MTDNSKKSKPQDESFAERLVSLISPGPNGSDVRATNTPEAWRPRMEIDESGGFVVSKPRPAGEIPDAADILKEFDLDPNSWEIVSLRKSRWQNHAGDFLEAARVSLRPIGFILKEKELDLEQLMGEIKKWKPTGKPKTTNGELAYIFAVSDQQIGKKTPTGGTPEFVERIVQITDDSIQRLKELRKIGRNIGTVVIPLLGDHVEGNTSQKGKLQSQYASDLGMTEQTRVARRILMEQIKAFAPLVDRIIVPVVNGNHDEVTRDVSVDPADGWNVEIASAVQDACAENPNLSHVEFRFPAPGNQTLSVNINGTMLGLFHGHQVSGKNVTNFLSGQAVGQTPLGNCDVWLSGHYHHFESLDIGTRFWAQCPTLDGGSQWFKDRRGLDSHPGVLTMVIGEDYDPRRDLSILRIKR